MQSKSLKETQDIASHFVKSLTPQDSATLVGLHGDLGAGKTSFTQGVARALGITDTVQSPTYVIMKFYDIPDTGDSSFKKLIHIDAYRLESGEELTTLGFKEILSDPHNLVLLEWPEKVESILPKTYTKINLEFVDETTRMIQIEPHK